MTVAIPIWQQRVSPVLDAAARLLVVRRRRGRLTEHREITLGVLAPDALARSVAELGVDVLLCGAVSEGLRQVIELQGVQVVSHLCGEVETVLQAFLSGNLGREEFCMPGCWRRYFHPKVAQRRRGVRRDRPRRSSKVR